MRIPRLVLAVVPVLALAGVGEVVLGVNRPPSPAYAESNCTALQFALDQTKTGFSEITGAQTKVPYYTSDKRLATDYATVFKFPSAAVCVITRYANYLPVMSCRFDSALDTVAHDVEACLIGLGGWIHTRTDYTWIRFERPGEAEIVITADRPYGYLTLWGNAKPLAQAR